MKRLVERHPCLRTTFMERQGQLLQRVGPEAEVALEVIDAANWDDELLRRRVEEELHRPFDFATGLLSGVASSHARPRNMSCW